MGLQKEELPLDLVMVDWTMLLPGISWISIYAVCISRGNNKQANNDGKSTRLIFFIIGMIKSDINILIF